MSRFRNIYLPATLTLFLVVPAHAAAPQEISLASNNTSLEDLRADAGACTGFYCVPKGTRSLLCEYVKLPDGNCRTDCRMVESCGDL